MKRFLAGKIWHLFFVLFVVLVLIVYFVTTMMLEPRLEDYVRQNLPEALKTRDISFNLFPLSVDLTEPTIETEAERTLSVRNIQFNPNVQSLFGDTFVIDTLEFEGVSLSFYQSGQPDTGAIEQSGVGSLFNTTGPQSNFRINRLLLTNSKVQLLESPTNPSPILDFSPINLSLGPITPATLRNGVSVHAVSGFQGVNERVFLRSTLKVSPTFSLHGELRLDKFKPEMLPANLTPGMRLNGGNLRGTFEFTYAGERLNLSSANLELRNSTIDFPEPSSVETALSPADQEVDTTESSPVTIDDLQLELSDVTINTYQLIPQSTPTALQLNEGLIKAGPYGGSDASVPVLGQLIFKQPAGLFEFKTDLALDQSPYRFKNFLSDLRVDNVNELNPYLGSLLPVRLKAGSLAGGIKGAFSSSDLDLAIELDFNRLKLGSGKTETSRFLGVPVKVYLNYLSNNDGNLELSFRMSGPPGSPNVEVNSIRNRILVNLGVDAAVLSTLGLPVYLGDKVVERVTGVSIINEAKNTFSTIFLSPKSADDPPTLKRKRNGTPIPSPKQ